MANNSSLEITVRPEILSAAGFAMPDDVYDHLKQHSEDYLIDFDVLLYGQTWSTRARGPNDPCSTPPHTWLMVRQNLNEFDKNAIECLLIALLDYEFPDAVLNKSKYCRHLAFQKAMFLFTAPPERKQQTQPLNGEIDLDAPAKELGASINFLKSLYGGGMRQAVDEYPQWNSARQNAQYFELVSDEDVAAAEVSLNANPRVTSSNVIVVKGWRSSSFAAVSKHRFIDWTVGEVYLKRHDADGSFSLVAFMVHPGCVKYQSSKDSPTKGKFNLVKLLVELLLLLPQAVDVLGGGSESRLGRAELEARRTAYYASAVYKKIVDKGTEVALAMLGQTRGREVGASDREPDGEVSFRDRLGSWSWLIERQFIDVPTTFC
ncbi:hypothetical protein HDU76_005269 [Blyttiomyces sp. JEL0837]|nr:hypothetical protein HDU76_005269 [Blyttiomyces sp. JEL0837]